MSNNLENKHQLKVNALAHLLELIDEVNKDIEASQQLQSDLLIKQYQHLKKDYTRQMLDLLKEYNLPLHVEEAA